MRAEAEDETVCCVICRQPLDERERQICRSNPTRFDGMLLCFEHQRRFSACPAVRGPIG